MRIKGMTTCDVCGRDFPLLIEDHYVARDPEVTGITKVIGAPEPNLYDVTSCPFCGCQKVLQKHKREWKPDCPCDYGICDECCGPDEDEEDTDE